MPGTSGRQGLVDFIERQALPVPGLPPRRSGATSPRSRPTSRPNRAPLAIRDRVQEQIDAWHRAHGCRPMTAEYQAFLREIGYLVEEGAEYAVTTEGVDPETARSPGAAGRAGDERRYALNAANARRGLLTTRPTAPTPSRDRSARQGRRYNPGRGAAVIAWARGFLDEAVPLAGASWSDARGLSWRWMLGVGSAAVTARTGRRKVRRLSAMRPRRHNRAPQSRACISARRWMPRCRPARTSGEVPDVLLEAAVTAIMDGEDFVAAVDAKDKVLVIYPARPDAGRPGRGGGEGRADIHPPVNPTSPTLPRTGRGLRGQPGAMLVRTVGHLMTNRRSSTPRATRCPRASWTR